MIAFNQTALNATFLVDEASNLKSSGFIVNNDLLAVKEQKNALKCNKNIFFRIGFLLLGLLLFGSVMLVLAWFVFLGDNNSQTSSIIYFALASIFGVFACEIISKQHYRFGIDDAFIVSTIGCIFGFIFCLLEYNLSSNEFGASDFTNGWSGVLSFAFAIVSAVFCLRYCNWVSCLLSACAAVCSFYFFCNSFVFGLKLMPFLMLLFGIGLFFLQHFLQVKNKQYFYLNSLLVVKVMSLALIYFSCNYLVVRQLSESLLGTVISKGQNILFAPFFWACTFLVPMFYLVWSILKKDKVLLYIGFLTLCFSMFTFRSYYSVLPIEIAMTLGGFVVFVCTLFIIKRIQNKVTGVTFKPARNANSGVLVGIEALIVNSQVNVSQTSLENPMKFGGGGFSGGGAGDSF